MPTPLSGFHHVSLTVADVDAATEWYCDLLGLEVVFREEGEDRRASVLRFPDGRYAVGLVQHRRPDDGFDATRIGLDHLAFTVATREDLDAWHEHLVGRGVESSGAVEIPPGAILNFKDPDGIALSLFWERP